MIKDEKGSSLVVVLIAMLLVTVLGVSFAFSADTEVTLSARSVNSTQAYHVARSGAEMGLSKIKDNIENYDEGNVFNDLVPGDFAGNLNDTDEYDVSFDPAEDEENNEYKVEISSTGTVDNPSNVSETVILEIDVVGLLETNPDDWLAGESSHIIHQDATHHDFSGFNITMDCDKLNPPQPFFTQAGPYVELRAYSLKFTSEDDDGDVLDFIGNSTLKINARFIEFYGNISGDFNQPGQPDELYLKNTEGEIRDEFENDEYDYEFGETEYGGVEYGVVYFENDEPVINGKSTGGPPNGESTYGPDSGYYFFPSGIELHEEDFGEHLIEVDEDDIEKIKEMFEDGPEIGSKTWK